MFASTELSAAAVDSETETSVETETKSEAGPPSGDNEPPEPEYPRKKKKIGLRSDKFNVNLGKVIDTLNQDYPLIFVKPLDYSIYIPDIEVTDPTGIAFQGINTYKSLFTILRFFAKTVFNGQSITYKIHYDYLNQAVRVVWHV